MCMCMCMRMCVCVYVCACVACVCALTVPSLLIETRLIVKLDGDKFSSKAWALGLGSALMTVSGYYGELVVTGDFTP